MVAVVNQLTDRPEGHVDIINDQLVADWRKEIFATTPLMSKMVWTWCVKELRHKAVYFRENQQVRVLDTGFYVCKLDTTALSALAGAFGRLASFLLEQELEQGGQYSQSSQVSNLVDPLLFPLVYGRSLVLGDRGKVDLHNMLGSYNDAAVAPKHFDGRFDSDIVQKSIEKYNYAPEGVSCESPRLYRWSSNYQCLPCEVGFLEESGTEM
ncbi:uncharacterized protein PGRI_049660 [Penicillium griseofulvum]|uniref:DUF4246 domain-containing protein n=1 Tax=Penicillium patulum TaxID=5078 RepID=A0A135LB86_PENPA|nr:uncharacterized protein PGRI_049660 [Penicillium griseofulvum]KXG46110.1 hypothetical protein PGRI_049660 [Penicillium griseofulvum]